MITEKDERVHTKSEYLTEFKEAIEIAFDKITSNVEDVSHYEYGGMRVKVSLVRDAFDRIVCNNGGFEIDARTVRHAHGIGNNNEWDVVDKDLVKVGSFYANDDMFGGVYMGVEINGEVVKRIHLR